MSLSNPSSNLFRIHAQLYNARPALPGRAFDRPSSFQLLVSDTVTPRYKRITGLHPSNRGSEPIRLDNVHQCSRVRSFRISTYLQYLKMACLSGSRVPYVVALFVLSLSITRAVAGHDTSDVSSRKLLLTQSFKSTSECCRCSCTVCIQQSSAEGAAKHAIGRSLHKQSASTVAGSLAQSSAIALRL